LARALRVVLIGGIPGTKSPAALSRLMTWARAHHPAEAARLAVAPKFEDLLIEEFNRAAENPAPNIIPLLAEPRPILRDLWLRTADLLKARLDGLAEQEDGLETVLVPVHLSWYHQRIREYIEVLDVEKLRSAIHPHSVVRVLCLIDDIQDIYCRLRAPGALYDREAATLDPRMVRRGHAFLRHLRILDWRARELLVAESVANRLACPMAVLATKHQPSVAFHYLSGLAPAYFSHPISEARDLEASGIPAYLDLAASIKEAMWELQECLAADMPLLQPTCVDEYRLRKEGAPILTDRFYPHGRYAHTMWSEVDCGDDVIFDDLGPNGVESLSPEEAAAAQDLGGIVLSFVENQVTSRDLQLVTQATNLIVYRPRFNGNLSRGVQAEIAYFDRLAQWSAARTADGDTTAHPTGHVILIDTAYDAAEFPVRQLLKAMVAATIAGEWSVSLREDEILQYQSRVSSQTRTLIQIAATTLGQVEHAVRSVLRDLGHDGAFNVTKVIAERPLGQSEYERQQETKTALFRAFQRALAPFDSRSPYAGRVVIQADGKNVEALAAEIVAAMA